MLEKEHSFLFMNTSRSHLLSYSASGGSSGLATVPILTGVSLGRARSKSLKHAGGPAFHFIFGLYYGAVFSGFKCYMLYSWSQFNFSFSWPRFQFRWFTSPQSCTVCTKTCQKEREVTSTGQTHCCHQKTGTLRWDPTLLTTRNKQRPQTGDICNPSNKHIKQRDKEWLHPHPLRSSCKDKGLEYHVPSHKYSQPRNHSFKFTDFECSFVNMKSKVWDVCVNGYGILNDVWSLVN